MLRLKLSAPKKTSQREVLIWVFPKMEVPQNGWFIILKWMIWGYLYSWKHPYLGLSPLPRMQTWPNDPRLRLNLPPLIRTVEDAEGVAAIAEWSQLPSWQLNLKFRGENDAGGGWSWCFICVFLPLYLKMDPKFRRHFSKHPWKSLKIIWLFQIWNMLKFWNRFQGQMIFQVDFMDAFQHPQSKLDNCCVLGEPLKPNIPLVNQKKSEEKMWFFAHISSRKSNPQMSHNFHFETPLFSNQETGKAKNPSFLARANSAQPLRFFLRDVFFPSPSFGGPQKIKPPGRGLNRKKKKRRRG